MTQAFLQYVMARVRDQRGAELVEWVIWVSGLVAVGAGATVALTGGLTGAINAIVALLPGGS